MIKFLQSAYKAIKKVFMSKEAQRAIEAIQLMTDEPAHDNAAAEWVAMRNSIKILTNQVTKLRLELDDIKAALVEQLDFKELDDAARGLLTDPGFKEKNSK